MSPFRWFLSALIAYHVIAVVVDAIPEADELKPVSQEIHHPKGDPTAAVLTPVFDWCAIRVARVEPMLVAATQPVRWVTRPYIHAGLRQDWKMFTDPWTTDRYVRLDYYVLSPGARKPARIQELVFPVGREDRMRVTHDFLDKAVVNLTVSFFEARTKPPRDGEIREGLVPLVRYFTNRFRTRQLSEGDRILRTEVWYGAARMPPRGADFPEGVLPARLEMLTAYYDGPLFAGRADKWLSTGAQEQHADITWTLEDIDTP